MPEWRQPSWTTSSLQSSLQRTLYTTLTRFGSQPKSCSFRHHCNSGRGTNTSTSSQSTQSHGTNEVSHRLLNETDKQISPALTLVFQASINQDKVPEEWKSANITPLFKKGDRSAPVNYRPVSLTSVCSKVMEHIIHSHIIKHMDKHGFRKRRSIETQLILSIDALAKSLDVGEQVDCILLDFSNYFWWNYNTMGSGATSMIG